MAQTAEAHHLVLRWAHVLQVQVGRLHRSRLAVLEGSREVRARRHHGPSDNEPFHLMHAEGHFTLTAAYALTKALQLFDGKLRLPDGLDPEQLKYLRDAVEHWEDQGRAAEWLAARGFDPLGHQWTLDGPGILGGGAVNDSSLRLWAERVYEDLVNFDPPSQPVGE